MIYESYLLLIFCNFQKYTIIICFTKRFEIVVAATLGKILEPPMQKQSNGSHLQENQEPQTTRTLSMICQIDVVNKQLVLHLLP